MYVVRPVAMPSDLAGASNGRLDSALLRNVDVDGDGDEDSGRLYHRAALSWTAMQAHARRDGIRLRATSSADTYRSYELQLLAFRTRYTTEPVSTSIKRFNGTTYYLRLGMAPSASPGTSNHGWGLAVDVCTRGAGTGLVPLAPAGAVGTTARDAWDWLIAHYESYGWSHEYRTPATEPWHIRYVVGDVTPPALVPPPVVVIPPEPEPIEEPDMLAIYKPTFVQDGYEPCWFVVFASGAVRRAVTADTQLADTLKLPTFNVADPSHYDELHTVSGTTWPARPR